MSEIKAKKIGCIVATTFDGYIGYCNDLMIKSMINRLEVPEKLAAENARKKDIEYFASMTTSTSDVKRSVIMGRKTWESLPAKYRPLPNRINIVITSDVDYELPPDVLKFRSIDEALEEVEVDEAWLIGGAGIYDEAVRFAHEVHVCKLEFNASCVLTPKELKDHATALPDWMKDPTSHQYKLQSEYPPQVRHRYRVDIYEYVAA